MAKRGLLFILLGFLFLGIVAGFHYNFIKNVEYPYEVAIGSHFNNAYKMPTPEGILKELNLAIEGMEKMEITPDLYSKWFSWQETPDKSMAFSYAYINNVINRTEAVIEWREQSIYNNTEQFQDVYERKVESIRLMIGDDRGYILIDGPIKRAYLLETYPIYYFGEMVVASLIMMAFTSIFGGWFLLALSHKYESNEIFGTTIFLTIVYMVGFFFVLLALTWANMAA